MTLDEMKLAVCEKLPEKLELIWGAKGEGDYYIWKDTGKKINWITEGLAVCHEAEKLLTNEQWNEYLRHILEEDAPYDEWSRSYLNLQAVQQCVFATAAQRVKAFLQAVGKWTEDDK